MHPHACMRAWPPASLFPLPRNQRFLTSGSLAALMGVTAGILLLLFQRYLQHGLLKNLLVFDSSTFLVYLLPPVIFNAGLSVHKQTFFENLATILAMGVMGE
jgi:hypothetical protein